MTGLSCPHLHLDVISASWFDFRQTRLLTYGHHPRMDREPLLVIKAKLEAIERMRQDLNLITSLARPDQTVRVSSVAQKRAVRAGKAQRKA